MRPGSLFARLFWTHVVVAGLAAGFAIAIAGASVAASVLIALVAVALAASVAALVAGSIARPVRDAVDHLAQMPDVSALAPAGPWETQALGSAINALAAEMRATIEGLRAEAQVRDQILGSMEEAVIMAETGGIVYANRVAREIFGPGPALPPQITVPQEGSVSVELELHHPARRDLRCTATVVGDQVLIVAQDVTESKRIDRIRRDFVANASHEMKTPVAAILATAETLQGAIADDPEAAARFATTLANEARRLSDLITDLLDLARLDDPAITEEPLSFTDLVDRCVQSVRPIAESKGVALSVSLEKSLMVRGRAEDLSALPRNLLDNAIRYTAAGGTVTVNLRGEDGTAVVLTVTDTGSGIPAKDLPRIFERFYRVDRARARETGGTGLGLSIVRHVAEAHGGSVHATSELGRGSRFVARLPLATASGS